jgi:hypothetical protein
MEVAWLNVLEGEDTDVLFFALIIFLPAAKWKRI